MQRNWCWGGNGTYKHTDIQRPFPPVLSIRTCTPLPMAAENKLM
jgi:hypothetical protein